jgi:hypothetical protein
MAERGDSGGVSVPFVPDPKRIEVVDEAVAAIPRTKTPAERVMMGSAANRTARLPIAGRILSVHPECTEAEVLAEVARRMLAAALPTALRSHDANR